MVNRLLVAASAAMCVIAASAGAATLPPGSLAQLPSETACMTKAWADTSREKRLENETANRTDVPDGVSFSDAPAYGRRVTGNFSGTTQQILTWAACKWGIDANLLKAQAVQESSWRQTAVGCAGDCFGILQIKRSTWPTSFPGSQTSTAFNADLSGMFTRACIDGLFAGWSNMGGYLSTTGRARVWYCIGVYYAGEKPTSENDGTRYVADVKRHLSTKTWRRSNF